MAKRSENFNFRTIMGRFCKRNLLASEECWTDCCNIDFSALETNCCKYRKGKVGVNLSPFVVAPIFDESISCKNFLCQCALYPKILRTFALISPRITNGLRSHVRNSIECFFRYQSTSKSVKKSCALFFQPTYQHSFSCLTY